MLGELGVGVDQRASLGDQSSMGSAGGSQKKRKAPERKDSPKRRNTKRARRKTRRWKERHGGQGGKVLRSKAASDSTGWHEHHG